MSSLVHGFFEYGRDVADHEAHIFRGDVVFVLRQRLEALQWSERQFLVLRVLGHWVMFLRFEAARNRIFYQNSVWPSVQMGYGLAAVFFGRLRLVQAQHEAAGYRHGVEDNIKTFAVLVDEARAGF